MRLSSGFEHRKARVEMLPLIDVVFILLVFFIYAMLSMVLHRGMAVRLPAASTATVERQDYVAVSVTEDSRVWVDRTPVEFDSLASTVQGRMGGSETNLPVFIECDEHADVGVAIRVLDRLREAGISQVMFASREAP